MARVSKTPLRTATRPTTRTATPRPTIRTGGTAIKRQTAPVQRPITRPVQPIKKVKY